MKATIQAIIDGRLSGHPGKRIVELNFEAALFAFNNLRVPESALDLGDIKVGDEVDVNFLPARFLDTLQEALEAMNVGAGCADAGLAPATNQCPWCGERFIELGPGKLSHWCAEESKAGEGRAQ